jgi:hypothetical protein
MAAGHQNTQRRTLQRAAARERLLEQALEEGLLDTFPASDAVAVVQPRPPEPDYKHLATEAESSNRDR